MECFVEGTEPRQYAHDEWEGDGLDFFVEDIGAAAPSKQYSESKIEGG